MKTFMTNAIRALLFPFVFLLILISRRFYLVSGTYEEAISGKRMYFRTFISTHRGHLPIKRLERSLGEKLLAKGEAVLITSIQRQPAWMAYQFSGEGPTDLDFTMKKGEK